MQIEFVNPSMVTCSIDGCKGTAVTSLQVGAPAFGIRLCALCLRELRIQVLNEYLEKVTIPGADERRKNGGIQ